MRVKPLVPLALFAAAACGNAAPARAIPPVGEIPVEAPYVARAEAPPASQLVAAEPGTLLLDHPEALRRFFAKLRELEAGRGDGDVRVVQFGDSHTAADYETGPLRRSLQKRFGDGGRGFVSVGRPWKFYTQEGVQKNGMTGWSPERGHFSHGKFAGDGLYGLLGVSIAASRAGARAYSDLVAATSHIELSYLETPHGGSVDIFVDGARVQRLHTSGPETRSAYADLEVTEGPHQVELDAVGDGSVRVFGAALDRAKVGVTLDALGVNGARASDLLRIREDHFEGELRHRDPALVVLAYGTNESTDDTPLAVYEKQLVDVLGRVARATPLASCLVLGPPDRAEKHRVVVPSQTRDGLSTVETVWTSVPRLLDVAAMERKVAAAAGCAYYSQLDAMGGPGTIAGWALEDPPRAALDRTHLSRRGYAELGDALADGLVHVYDAYKTSAPPLPPRAAPPLPIVPPSTDTARPVALGARVVWSEP
jgi:lysophospholipase L1-like esterase